MSAAPPDSTTATSLAANVARAPRSHSCHSATTFHTPVASSTPNAHHATTANRRATGPVAPGASLRSTGTSTASVT